MAENENMVINNAPPENTSGGAKVSVGAKVWGGIKEWCRKRIVSLKRSPQRIPLIITLVSSVLWLISLFSFSRTAYALQGIEYLGLVMFATTLLSILILPLFLNAFPKRKKPNIAFIVLFFIFIVAMIVLDILYYSEVYTYLFVDNMQTQEWIDARSYINQSLNLIIAHVVLLAISALSLAFMPLYAPLIKKINTSKEIAGNDIHGTIDVEDDE